MLFCEQCGYDFTTGQLPMAAPAPAPPPGADWVAELWIDPDWFAELGPGWQQRWLMNFATLQTGGFADEDLVMDGWTDISKRIRDRVVENISKGGLQFGPEAMLQAYEESDEMRHPGSSTRSTMGSTLGWTGICW